MKRTFAYTTFAPKPYVTFYLDTKADAYDFINKNNIISVKFCDRFKEIPDLSQIKTHIELVEVEQNNRLKLDNLVHLRNSLTTIFIHLPVHKGFDFHKLPNLEWVRYHWDKPEQGLGLFTHPNLKKLDINKIFVEDDMIEISSSLEHLILGFPKNETLGFLKNGNIKTLDIQRPKKIANLHGLPSSIEFLNVHDGPLNSFDGISELTNLKSFISRCGYEGKIPDAIFSLEKLEAFKISGHPTEFRWERFFEMPNIRKLAFVVKAPIPKEEELATRLLKYKRKLTYYSCGGTKNSALVNIEFEPV